MMSGSTARRRGTRLRRIATVLVVLAVAAGVIFFGVRALWNTAQRSVTYNHCTVGGYDLDPDQAENAATMTGAVAKFSPPLPERATVLALAAALQESKLRNLRLGQGDRDSVGVLQQRLQYWGGGDANKLNDVGEATREFLAALVKIPHWQTLPLAEAVQDVQVSADGSAYAQHEPEATALARALDGSAPRAISCQFTKPDTVAATTHVAQRVRADLPVATPSTTATEVRVTGAHWQTAAWFVAYAYRLGIEEVSFAGYTWSRAHGWRTSGAGSAAVVATMYRKR
jgi:hypothetical protein